MGLEERAVGVSDKIAVELVTVAPDPPQPETQVVSTSPDASPTERAAEATIEQTGSGPPPKASR